MVFLEVCTVSFEGQTRSDRRAHPYHHVPILPVQLVGRTKKRPHDHDGSGPSITGIRIIVIIPDCHNDDGGDSINIGVPSCSLSDQPTQDQSLRHVRTYDGTCAIHRVWYVEWFNCVA